MAKNQLKHQKRKVTYQTCEQCKETKLQATGFSYKKRICKICHPQPIKSPNINTQLKELLILEIKKSIIKDEESTTYMSYLGCNIQFVREWVEYNRTEDMNWKNFGSTWVIDHVIPKQNFDLNIEEEKYKFWNWSNLIPNIKDQSIDFKKVLDKLENFIEDSSTTKWFSENTILAAVIH